MSQPDASVVPPRRLSGMSIDCNGLGSINASHQPPRRHETFRLPQGSLRCTECRAEAEVPTPMLLDEQEQAPRVAGGSMKRVVARRNGKGQTLKDLEGALSASACPPRACGGVPDRIPSASGRASPAPPPSPFLALAHMITVHVVGCGALSPFLCPSLGPPIRR